MKTERLTRWLAGGLALVLLAGCGDLFAPPLEPLVLLATPQPPVVFEDAYMATGDLMDHPRVSPPVYQSGTAEVVVVAMFRPLPDDTNLAITITDSSGEPVPLGETMLGAMRNLKDGVTTDATVVFTIKPQDGAFADGTYQTTLSIAGADFAVLNWRVSGNRPLPPTSTRPSIEDLPGATLTPPPSATPPPAGVEYVVAPGDTLSVIAEKNNVTLEDLTSANGLKSDADLKVGQTLVIPVPIILTVTTGDIATESVEIWNQSSRPIDISGWVLDNGRGDSFLFPMARLLPSACLFVLSGVGTNTPVTLYWGRETPAFRPGDQVTLTDSQGKVWAQIEVGQ